MNIVGNSMVLNDGAGTISDGGVWSIVSALTISRTLVGTLTITGIVDSAGSPVAWSLAPGTTAGVYAAPGSAATGGKALAYVLSSGSDAGAAVIAWRAK